MRSLEIGGYFELERFHGELYHKDAIALNCGRGCLSYLVALRGIESIWIPDWICGSVPALFRREGVKVKVYRVGRTMLPDYDFSVVDGDWMLLADYYGQLRAEDVRCATAHSHGRLIVDETQGFFRAPWHDADTLYTCRKWFGVADGGYLVTADGMSLARELPRDESHARMGFVLGRFERPAGEFFSESRENNHLLSSERVKTMSPITENILRAVDYSGVAERRRENWRILADALGASNALSLDQPEVPFMYPYMTEGAQDIRRRLIEDGVFVPMLWPELPEGLPEGSLARSLSESILPLPVDQRYGEEEMGFIVSCLAKAGVSLHG